MTTLEHVHSLIHGAVRAPDEEIRGASGIELAALRTRLGRDLPAQLAELLTICNGARIGPGGLFGHRPDDPYVDLPSYIDLFPQWAERGWLPVAGDGCGNYYVLLADDSVGFIDPMTVPNALDERTHADLFEFVEAILASDQADHFGPITSVAPKCHHPAVPQPLVPPVSGVQSDRS